MKWNRMLTLPSEKKGAVRASASQLKQRVQRLATPIQVLVPRFNQNFGVKCRAAIRTTKAIGSDHALVATMVEK